MVLCELTERLERRVRGDGEHNNKAEAKPSEASTVQCKNAKHVFWTQWVRKQGDGRKETTPKQLTALSTATDSKLPQLRSSLQCAAQRCLTREALSMRETELLSPRLAKTTNRGPRTPISFRTVRCSKWPFRAALAWTTKKDFH
jgi:hypothetical protein